jgi:hypothetical protein
MSRAGMVNLITRLRAMTDAGTADYTVADESYWGDEHILAVLDRHRIDLQREPLTTVEEYLGGTLGYFNYYTSFRNLEEAASGTPFFDIQDDTYASIGTANYTANYDAGIFRFTTDTEGSARYLTTRSYDLRAAAADIWERKAAHYVTAYDFSADGASFKRSQLREHCLAMADHYRKDSQHRMKVSRLVRSDVAVDDE